MEISNVTIARITRDAEVEIDDEPAADFRATVKEQIRQRRYEPVVRLEFGAGADPAITEMLRARFELSPRRSIRDAGRGGLHYTVRASRSPHPGVARPRMDPALAVFAPRGRGAIFTAMHAGDLLVHHPYESFDASVEHFISAAADDPQTVSIKMTAYRIGDDTPFVKSLIRAAERGKQVACVMEIKARFDEERNLHWAAELERAGPTSPLASAGSKPMARRRWSCATKQGACAATCTSAPETTM